jgi:DNA-binding response OmpR family regulator
MKAMAKKVLIIEDDRVAAQILFRTLSGAGYETAIAADAMAAVSEARKHQPAVILLDLGLPAGGGFIVLQRLKSFPALANIPVIVISGLDRAANEAKALQAGAAAYLQKPASPEQVISVVQTHS